MFGIDLFIMFPFLIFKQELGMSDSLDHCCLFPFIILMEFLVKCDISIYIFLIEVHKFVNGGIFLLSQQDETNFVFGVVLKRGDYFGWPIEALVLCEYDVTCLVVLHLLVYYLMTH